MLRVETRIMFPFVVHKVLFEFLEYFLETLKILPLSVGKLFIYLLFFLELFQCHIHSKHKILYLYQLIFQNNIQFLHFHTGQYLIVFLKNSNISTRNFLNQTAPFLTFTDFLFIFLFIHIFLSQFIMKITFHFI